MPGIREKLGEAVLELRTDDKQYNAGIDKAEKRTGSFTGSMIKAQLAVDTFKFALRAAANFLKESTNRFIVQEKAVAQLGAVLKSTGHAAGMTRKELLDLASGLQSVTEFGDEAIIGAENILLTFTKIGKETFPQATETVLNLSAALGQDLKSSAIQLGKVLNDPNGMAAMRRVGVSFTDAQIAMGKELAATGKMAEYQKLVLEELNTEFGGVARAMRNTFGGAVNSLKNRFGDLQEVFGSYVAKVGRPFIENMIKMTDGVVKFLQSEAGMKTVMTTIANLAGSLSVATNMAGKIWDIFSKFTGNFFTDLANGFKKVTGKADDGAATFTVLGAVVQTIGAGFAIAGKVIHAVIENIANLVDVVKKSIGIFEKFGAAITDPFNAQKWAEVGDAAKSAGAAFTDAVGAGIENFTDIIGTTINEFSKLGTGAEKVGADLKKAYTEANNAIVHSFNGSSEAILESEEKKAIALKNGLEAYNNYRMYYGDTLHGIKVDTVSTIDELIKTWTAGHEAMAGAVKTWGAVVSPIFEEIGTALYNQGLDWSNVGKAAVLALAGIVKALGDQLSAMAAAKLIEGFARLADPFLAWAAPGAFSSAGLLGSAAAGAWIASGLLKAWAGSFQYGGTANPGIALVGEAGPELINLGRTSRIESNKETRKLLRGGDIIMNIGQINNNVELEKESQKMLMRYRAMGGRN